MCHCGDTGWLQTPLNNYPVVVYHSSFEKSMEVTAIMRKIMSVGELKRYYENRSPRRILFCTVNQAWHKVDTPLKASLTFTSMAIACNPNAICLKSGDNTLWFERVKSVTVDSGRSPLGTVLDIICGDSVGKENDIHYTVITS
jgi:hypothetical protein